MKQRVYKACGMAGILLIFYLVVEKGLFFLHGMRQWPLLLFLFCLIQSILACLLNRKISSITAAVSYPLCFAMAYFLQRTEGWQNNLWLLWLLGIMAMLVISLGIDTWILRKECAECDEEAKEDDD